MNNRGPLTKVLAIIGTVLIWLPLLTPLFLGLISLGIDGIFRLDYLMPAELFLLVAVGGALLIWAAWRVRAHLALIGGPFVVAVVALIGAQLLAIVTGLAHGTTEPGGWQWFLVLSLLTVYTLSIAAMGVGGILLLRELFRQL